MVDAKDYTKIEYTTRVRANIADVFNFHIRLENINRIIPLYPSVKILQKPEKIDKESTFAVGLFFLPLIGIYWESRVVEFEENRLFADEQISAAPFKYWRHEHEFVQDGDWCIIIDRVQYKMHFGFIGKIFDTLIFRHSMRFFFYYRSLRLKRIF